MNFHFITYRPYTNDRKKDKLDRYKHFLSNNKGRIEEWSARKTFAPGDLAFFYFGQPLMTLAAVAYVDSDPYVKEMGRWADFSNPVFCDYAPARILKEAVPIKETFARQPKLAKWWKSRPYQSIRRIEPDIAIALLQGIVRGSPADGDFLDPLIQGLIEGDSDTKPTAQSAAPAASSKTNAPTKKKNWTYSDLMSLTWEQFEALTADLFSHRHQNAVVRLTAGRADQGVDVFITDPKTQEVEIVQCKRYRRKSKVSSIDMQKFAGAMKKFKARRGYFVTSSSFNAFALTYVEDMDDIELIEGKSLLALINADPLIPPRAEFQ
jgi:hypothetical protein